MSEPISWFSPGEVAPADEMTAAWWEATRHHRLSVQACACGHRQLPPRALCTRCGRTDRLALADASGDAVVDTYTVVHRAPRAGVETPYVVARVRLAEGPILLTRLAAEPAIGDPVAVAWVDLPDGRALPVFTPEEKR